MPAVDFDFVKASAPGAVPERSGGQRGEGWAQLFVAGVKFGLSF
jgi:hypothetical protein